MTQSLETESYEAYARKNYLWNLVFNVGDGAFYWLTFGLASTMTVLPLYISHFTSSALLIGLPSTLANLGWFLPQLFTASYVEKLPRKLPFVLLVSLNERLPFLFMGLTILFWPSMAPGLALVFFFLFFCWYSFGAGFTATGWQELIAKIMPERKRGLFFGLQGFFGGILGMLGALASQHFLENHPFPYDFAYLFLLGFVALMVSWCSLALTREMPSATSKPPIPYRAYLRRLPLILHQNRNYTFFLIAQAIACSGTMAYGFIAIYAVKSFHLPDHTIGWFTAVYQFSQILSNPLLGRLGDEKGHKLVLEMAAFNGVLATGVAFLAHSPGCFYLAMAFSGFAIAGRVISGMSIVYEFCSPDDRPTYIGLTNTLLGPFIGLSPIFGGWVADTLGYQTLFGLAFLLDILACGLWHWLVKDPRHASGSLYLEERGCPIP